MLLFGVTGGIGSGKSVVCSFLKEKGISIIEADPLAKDLTTTSPEIHKALTRQFGPNVYTNDGQINKKRMNELVFSDSETRMQINSIIHPHVLKFIQAEAKRLFSREQQKMVGVEAALIYESQMEKILDKVVVVDAPLERRISWLQERNHLSREEVLKRMEAQIPIDDKIKRADYVVKNDGDLSLLQKRCHKLFTWLEEQSQVNRNTSLQIK